MKKSDEKRVMRSLYKIPCGAEKIYFELFVMPGK